MDITLAICSSVDGVRIVNATTEAAAYQLLMGEPLPENGPDWSLEWDCTIITLKNGEAIDPSRYM